jgi:DNA-directed RNA polymerase specialized sigma24 family protein
MTQQPTLSDDEYRTLRRVLIHFFSWRDAKDPQDLADETILRVLTNVAEGQKIEDTKAYTLGVAGNVLQEWRRKQAQIAQLAVILPDAGGAKEVLSRCLEVCKKRLTREERVLIESYFQGEKGVKIENRRRLAQKRKITPGALSQQVLRIRNKLSLCLVECMRQYAVREMKSPIHH